MRLTWDGYPLHYDEKEAWGYLVPKSESQLKKEEEKRGNQQDETESIADEIEEDKEDGEETHPKEEDLAEGLDDKKDEDNLAVFPMRYN